MCRSRARSRLLTLNTPPHPYTLPMTPPPSPHYLHITNFPSQCQILSGTTRALTPAPASSQTPLPFTLLLLLPPPHPSYTRLFLTIYIHADKLSSPMPNMVRNDSRTHPDPSQHANSSPRHAPGAVRACPLLAPLLHTLSSLFTYILYIIYI